MLKAVLPSVLAAQAAGTRGGVPKQYQSQALYQRGLSISTRVMRRCTQRVPATRLDGVKAMLRYWLADDVGRKTETTASRVREIAYGGIARRA